MNERITDPDDRSQGDDVVSSHYQDASRESVPNHLDDAVLERAAAEVARDRWQFRFHPWLRPLAVAATVTLSLTVLLEVMSSAPDDDQIIEDFSSAATDASERMRALGETTAASRPPGNPTAASGPGAIDALSAQRYCSDSAIADAERWWTCILALREEGRLEEADAELQRMRTDFPDFSPRP